MNPLLDLSTRISGYGAAAILVVVKLFQRSKLDAIPTVGSSGWLGSCWAGLMFLTNAMHVVQEGYEKHKSAPFKIAELYHWTVVLCSREHVEELRRTPDDVLSFLEATNDLLHVEYTMGPEIHHNPYHVQVVRSQMTRNIVTLYPEIRNEIVTAFDDVLDLNGNEWKSVSVVSSMEKVVCRSSNRVFVGLPLCRNPEWLDLCIHYAIDVVKGGYIIALFPDLFKPMATRLFTNIKESKQRAARLLGPIIKERQQYINEHGNEWADKPNDALSWLMEEAEGPELAVTSLTTRILVLNFVAIHTTSHSFAHALFRLAANPQYVKPLRDEVETIVDKEGWTKLSLGKMRKVDSFLKECQRLEGVIGLGLRRKALKDFTFSDGTFIPKGTTVTTAVRSMHRGDGLYENARDFKPFRFSDSNEGDQEDAKHWFVSITTEYLPFGYGRHACAGRFFAASEMKTMLAQIVVTYDVKLADNFTACPQSLLIGTAVVPDPRAKVMFRRRVD